MARELKHAYYKAIGHSSHDVTGSCHLIRFKDYTILLDYGMYQTNDPIEDYKINKARHKDIKPKDIDYIFVSHIHADHIGLLPSLYRDGCTAPIFISKKSKRLLRIMLMDSVNIMERDCERYNKRNNVSMHPIYSKHDVDTMMKYVKEVTVNSKHKVNEDIKFKLISANHIINATQIMLEINDGTAIKKVGYTGDIGSPRFEKPFIEQFEPIDQVDLLIGECTYATNLRTHKKKDRNKDIDKIQAIVTRCLHDKSKILIPVFSLNRLEEVLSVLYDTYHDSDLKIPIIVDTPLGTSIADAWETTIEKDVEYWHKVWNWKNIQKPDTYKESVAWQQIDGAMIVLSSGGMLTAGRAVGWAHALLPHHKNHIVFCGFTSERSLASQIKNQKDNKQVKIDGKPTKNNAQVSILNSFSSHADHDELLDYYTEVKYNKIALVHSEAKSKIQFAEELKTALSKANRASRVICVNQDTKINI
ncbi:metallo-beta-lactamase family protein [Clostridiales Family XIII bacterium PM5-7]